MLPNSNSPLSFECCYNRFKFLCSSLSFAHLLGMMNPTDLPFQPKIISFSKRGDVLSTISSPLNLIQEFKNFKSSSDPSRFLYFENGSWFDFAREVSDKMRDGFLDGKSTLQVSIGGASYIFDFLRKVKVDSQTGTVNSISWIDITGKCFFPQVVVDSSSIPKTGMEVSPDEDSDSDCSSNSNSRKRKRDTRVDSFEECTDESPDVSSGTITSHTPKFCKYNNLQGPRLENAHKVEKEDRLYKVVEKLFLAGMARSSVAPLSVEVTAVNKCMQVSPEGSLRLKAFQLLVQEMKSLRGENCVKYGWYGANPTDLESVLGFGFGTTNSGLLGTQAHGMGVHLTSPHFPYDSAMMAREDEKGERHVILCRVIMGRPEQVEAGSSRSHPSSAEYDSGVDNLQNPKWYIVWGTHMNTHILPEYLVTFKISKPNNTSLEPKRVKKQNLGNLQFHFPKMISEMKQSLNPSRIQAIQHSYNLWEEGKMSKEAFIRFLRTYAGDKLLITVIKKIRGY